MCLRQCWVGLAFGIPTAFMGLAILNFFTGVPLYKFQKSGDISVMHSCQVIVASLHKLQKKVP